MRTPSISRPTSRRTGTTRITTRTSIPPRRWGRIPPSVPLTARRCRHRATPTAASTASTPTPAPPPSRQVPLRLLIIGSMSYSKPQQGLLRQPRPQLQRRHQLQQRRQLQPRPPPQLRRRLLRFKLLFKQISQVLASSLTLLLTRRRKHFPGCPAQVTPLPQHRRRTVPQAFDTHG